MYNIMKIISFDVGIKNLAYCIFDVSQSIHIADWRVVSLMNHETPTLTCTCKKSKKAGDAVCNRIAKYKKGAEAFCATHAKSQSQWLVPEAKYKSVKKLNMEKLLLLCDQLGQKSAVDKKKKPEVLLFLTDYLAQRCLEQIGKSTVSANNTDLVSIGKNMKTVLSDILPEDITGVLIENQISPIANRMKTIQGMLAQYFIMVYEPIDVEFISSANKLKMFQTEGTTYKDHKKDEVHFCEELLEKNHWMSFWTNAKKKDDLADCFLQGIWYLKKMDTLPQSFVL